MQPAPDWQGARQRSRRDVFNAYPCRQTVMSRLDESSPSVINLVYQHATQPQPCCGTSSRCVCPSTQENITLREVKQNKQGKDGEVRSWMRRNNNSLGKWPEPRVAKWNTMNMGSRIPCVPRLVENNHPSPLSNAVKVPCVSPYGSLGRAQLGLSAEVNASKVWITLYHRRLPRGWLLALAGNSC